VTNDDRDRALRSWLAANRTSLLDIPGVLGVGTGLVGERELGILILVRRGADPDLSMVPRRFPMLVRHGDDIAPLAPGDPR
jgi:hypothetical protein